jgi:uncharacterized protein
METKQTRLQVVDALRGFAIVSIMLLHNIEHFDFYFTPANRPDWIIPVDKGIWDTLFFLFGGKSYAIFALLFGLTFFIQYDNQERKGRDFRPRFAWRMVLLIGFGILNSAFYQGDILLIYALIGFFILPFARLSNKLVFWSAVILMAQPFEWYNVFSGLQSTSLPMNDPLSWSYFGKANEYIPGSSMSETIIGNLTNGKKAVFLWTWEQGRVFQTLSLFLLGMLAGRKALFSQSENNRRFWIKALIIASILFIPLFVLKSNIHIESEAIRRPLQTIITSWSNMAFMILLVSVFTLLFWSKSFYKVLNYLSPFGRMSLSNYIIQSVIGSFIYYGFGLGLYQYTGATYSLLIGIVLALLQGMFSTWWMKRHPQGPLETLWHKATWI